MREVAAGRQDQRAHPGARRGERVEHRDQGSAVEVLPDEHVEHLGDPQAGARRGDERQAGVGAEVRGDPHGGGMLTRGLEPPLRVGARRADEAQAPMIREVRRGRRRAGARDVGGRRDGAPPQLAQPDGHERGVGERPDPHRDVDVARHQVDRRVGEAEIDLELRVVGGEPGQRGDEDLGEDRGGRDPGPTPRMFEGRGGCLEPVPQLVEGGARVAEQVMAGRRHLDAAGRPLEQDQPEVVFQPGDRLADRRRVLAEPAGRLAEAPGLGGGDERFERGRPLHALLLSWQQCVVRVGPWPDARRGRGWGRAKPGGQP